jgi:L-erythro-3,5-diaminohexanoate dehydrogenase
MKESVMETRQRLGADRVIAPAGALPQPADRLDASGPVRPFEFELAVERLRLDSTSHREIAERCDGDAGAMATRIEEIVAKRGKMHNPETDSGGILTGTVSAVGESYTDPPEPGDRVATLASLTLTPLRLDAVTRVDPASPLLEARGSAYVCDRAAWARMPTDLPEERAIEIFDVCACASHVRRLAPTAGTVCVLGAGHAGKLALAAARDSVPEATLVAVDVDADAVAAVHECGLCDIAVATDLRDPLAALDAVRDAGAGPADLTVVVVNATRCEAAAILLTADEGTVIFFSMATSFGAAALTSDGLSSKAAMFIGSGYSPDGGEYALELVRGSAALREAFGIAEVTA